MFSAMVYCLLSLLHPFRSSFPGQILRSEQCDTRSSRPKDMACSAFGSLPWEQKSEGQPNAKVANSWEAQKTCVISWYQSMTIYSSCTCSTVAHSLTANSMSGRQNVHFEVEQRVFVWRRWANPCVPWLHPNTADLAQTGVLWHLLARTKDVEVWEIQSFPGPWPLFIPVICSSCTNGSVWFDHKAMTYQCQIAPRARGAYKSALHNWVIAGHAPAQMPPSFELMVISIFT